jgi:hypothetical protein
VTNGDRVFGDSEIEDRVSVIGDDAIAIRLGGDIAAALSQRLLSLLLLRIP